MRRLPSFSVASRGAIPIGRCPSKKGTGTSIAAADIRPASDASGRIVQRNILGCEGGVRAVRGRSRPVSARSRKLRSAKTLCGAWPFLRYIGNLMFRSTSRPCPIPVLSMDDAPEPCPVQLELDSHDRLGWPSPPGWVARRFKATGLETTRSGCRLTVGGGGVRIPPPRVFTTPRVPISGTWVGGTHNHMSVRVIYMISGEETRRGARDLVFTLTLYPDLPKAAAID